MSSEMSLEIEAQLKVKYRSIVDEITSCDDLNLLLTHESAEVRRVVEHVAKLLERIRGE